MTTGTVSRREHVYAPRGTARQAFSVRVPELLYAGPAGTGKSRALLERLHVMALKYPGMRGLIVRKYLSTLGNTALQTWRQHVTPEAQLAGVVTYYGGSQSEPAQYKYVNGSRIMIGGMDKSTKIMSSEYDIVYAQEAIELSLEDWEAIITRLRNGMTPYQMIMGDTNPAQPTHWLKKRCDAGRCVMIDSRHEDNPILFNLDGTMTERGAAYMAALDSLTGVRYLRLRKGLWVAAEGLIYEEFNPAVHVLSRFRPPPDWPRYWSVDFGFANPFVLGCWAVDPDGRLYLYREIYRSGRIVEDHARDILDVVAPRIGGENSERRWREPKPQAIICDHDAEDRATLERHLGLPTTAANKAVLEGLNVVAERLRLQADGKPRLFLMRDVLLHRDDQLEGKGRPTSTLDEAAGYVWAKKSVTESDRLKDEPKKEDDHGMDMMRYMVAHLDAGKGMGYRSIPADNEPGFDDMEDMGGWI